MPSFDLGSLASGGRSKMLNPLESWFDLKLACNLRKPHTSAFRQELSLELPCCRREYTFFLRHNADLKEAPLYTYRQGIITFRNMDLSSIFGLNSRFGAVWEGFALFRTGFAPIR